MEEHPTTSLDRGVPCGEHPMTVDHPVRTGQAVLTLDGDTVPHGPIYDLPLPEDGAIRDPDGTYRGHGFPANEHFDEMTGWLRYGLPVRLYDVDIAHFDNGRARLYASAALVGRAVASDREPLFTGLRMQCSGLGNVFGTEPISHYQSDGAFTGGPTTYISVHVDDAADQTWTRDGVEVAARWNQTLAGIGGKLYFEVSASPLLSVTGAGPAPWRDWLRRWVVPIHDLVSLATGTQRKITMLTVTADIGDDRWGAAEARVFGTGISQRPFSVRPGRYEPPLFTLKDLPYPAHELVERWLSIRSDLTGFVDAYLPVVRDARQTPAAQVVLLAAAAEALHSHRHGEGPTTADEHRARRDAVLAAATPHLDEADAKFLRRHLSRNDRFSLGDRVKALVSACPDDLVDVANLRTLHEDFGRVRNDLSHGRTVDDAAMVDVIRRMRLVLDCQLLVELGLSTDRVKRRLDD